MQKKYLSLAPLASLLLIAAPRLALAQTGAVGIGTTAPDASAALDIVSSGKGVLLPRVAAATSIASPAPGLLVYQTGAPAGFYYNSGTAAAPAWQQLATGAALAFGNGLTQTGSAVGLGGTLGQNTTLGLAGYSLGLTGGNVGIGTSSPGQQLEVAGQVFSNKGGFRFPDNTVQTTAGLTGGSAILNQTSRQANSDFSISGSGFAGGSLGAVISLSTSGDLFAGGRSTTLGNATVSGNMGIGIDLYNTTAKLDVNGLVASRSGGFRFPDGTVQATAFSGSSAIFNQTSQQANSNFNISGNGTVGGNSTVGGSSTVASNSYVGGNSTVGGNSMVNGGITVFGSSTVFGNSSVANVFSAYTGLFSRATVYGEMGIGTTAPDASAVLDIVSSGKGVLLPRVAAATSIAKPAPGLLVYQTGSPAGFYYNSGTAAAPAWQQLATAGSGGGAGDNLGNHTATQNLDLAGYQLVSGGSTGLALSSAGNVGIGTTSAPSQKLEVAGNVKISGSGNGLTFPDGTIQTTASTPGNLTGDVISSGNATTYNNVVPAAKGGAGAVSGLLKADGSGMVSAAVAGTDYLTPAAGTGFLQNTTTVQPASNFNISGAGTVGGLLTAGSATVGGNVGIGPIPAADPITQLLDVRGNVRLGNNGGNSATGTGPAIEWVGPGVNTDPVGIYRVNPASDQSELRVVVGDVPDANDKFSVGRMAGTNAEGGIPAGTFTPTFTVRADGNVGIGTTAPTSTLQVAGSVAASIRTLGSGTLAATDYTVLVTGSVSLPAPDATNVGRLYHLLNGNTGSNTISGTFRDAGTSGTFGSFTLGTANGGKGLTVQSDGTQWWILTRE